MPLIVLNYTFVNVLIKCPRRLCYNTLLFILQVQSYDQYDFLHTSVVRYAKQVEQSLEEEARNIP